MRGTTPVVTFKIPLKAEMITKAKMTFKHKKVLFEKHTKDCTIEDGKVSTALTREETLLFPDGQYIKIQLEIETPAGQYCKTKPHSVFSTETAQLFFVLMKVWCLPMAPLSAQLSILAKRTTALLGMKLPQKKPRN